MASEPDEDQRGKLVEITVNRVRALVRAGNLAGRELKQEAIAQGARLQLGFQLWLQHGNRYRAVYDDDLTDIRAGQEYLAITTDDHGPPSPVPAQEPVHGHTAEGWSLTLPPRLRAALPAYLLREDGGEHAAVILAEQPRGLNGRQLVGAVFIAAVDHVDYIEGSPGYASLDVEFIRNAVVRARDEGLAYLAVHNHHSSTNPVGFSHIDLASHERGYPTLCQITGQLVGGLVLTEHAMIGDLWLPDGTRAPLTDVDPFPSP